MANINFAAHPGSSVNAQERAALRPYSGTLVTQRMESLAQWGILPALDKWCGKNRLVFAMGAGTGTTGHGQAADR